MLIQSSDMYPPPPTYLPCLWDLVKKYGKKTRDQKLDGAKRWQDLVAKLEPLFKGYTFKWTEQALTLYDTMIGELQLIESNEGVDHALWEKHHFFLQHGRVPHKNAENPELIKLFQVAYNAGQLSSVFADELYTENNRRDFYNEKSLDELGTYCNVSDVDRMIVRAGNILTILETYFLS